MTVAKPSRGVMSPSKRVSTHTSQPSTSVSTPARMKPLTSGPPYPAATTAVASIESATKI